MASTSAPSLQFPPDFHKSYLDFSRYPSNTILKCDYPDVLESQRSRFNTVAEDLLTDPSKLAHTPKKPNEPKIRVNFRDWNSADQSQSEENAMSTHLLTEVIEFVRWKVDDENELRSWLGDCTPAAATSLIDLTKADPKCRFVWVEEVITIRNLADVLIGFSTAKLQGQG